MDNNTLLQKLADIEQPAPPEWRGFIVFFIVTVILLTLAAWALWHWRAHQQNKMRTPVSQALGLLDELNSHWSNGDIDDRETSYRLSTLLRLALGLKQIDSTYPNILENNPDPNKSKQNKKEWEKTIHLFSQIRYQASTPAKLNADIFQTIKGWLRAMPEQQAP